MTQKTDWPWNEGHPSPGDGHAILVHRDRWKEPKIAKWYLGECWVNGAPMDGTFDRWAELPRPEPKQGRLF